MDLATANTSADGTSDPNGIFAVSDTLTSSSNEKAYTFTITNDQAGVFELATTNTDYYMAVYDVATQSIVIEAYGQYLNSLIEDNKLTAGEYEIIVGSLNTVGTSFTLGVNVTNPGDNTNYFVPANLSYVGLVCNNGDIYSNGTAVYTGGDTSNLNWEGQYNASLGEDGSTTRTQIIDSIKVNTSESVISASYNTTAYNGVNTYSSPEVLLIPLDAGTSYMYHYVSYIDNQLEDTFYDTTGQPTPRSLTDHDLATEGFQVTSGTTTVTLPVSLAYDMRTNTVFDFCSYLNFYYSLHPSDLSVTILG